MKKTPLILIITLLLSSILLNSCKKDEEKTSADLLTDHPWFGVKVEKYIDEQLAETNDISSRKMVFYENKTYKFYDNNELEDEGTWKIEEGSPDKIITVDSDGDEMEAMIIELSEDKLEVYTLKEINGVNYKYVIKYKK